MQAGATVDPKTPLLLHSSMQCGFESKVVLNPRSSSPVRRSLARNKKGANSDAVAVEASRSKRALMPKVQHARAEVGAHTLHGI